MEGSWENWLYDLGMNGGAASTTSISGLSFEEIKSFNGQSSDNSNAVPKQDYSSLKTNNEELGSCCSPHLTAERAQGNHDLEAKENRRTKRARSSSEALDHIMSERKRRQELAEKFIALSATIPGLKKIDKASVLQEAINHVKQLQERIAVLEKEGTNKKVNEVLPEVEARGLEKELLIRIHCEKRNGIMLKLLALLENIHLSIASTSILPFGDSALNIVIIAQMTEEYNLTMNDLVKTVKQNLLKLYDMQL